MKMELWYIGKTSFDYLKTGESLYQKRLERYLPFQIQQIDDVKNAKNMSSDQLKEKEAAKVLKKLDSSDYLVLLDEKGKEFTSVQFSQYLEKQKLQSYKKLVFLIGGAFGFSPALYQRANQKIALSKMTFSHQMIRIFVLEQLYRACTILNNEPYHNT